MSSEPLKLQNLWIGCKCRGWTGAEFHTIADWRENRIAQIRSSSTPLPFSRSIASSPYNQGKALPLVCQYNRPDLYFCTSIAAIRVLNAQLWQLFEALLALSAPRVPLLDPSLPREHTPPSSAIQLGVMPRQADPQFQSPRHLP
jgi:hypothetical protein